jgi:predicted DNA-binding transcriptional regulator AlpA
MITISRPSSEDMLSSPGRWLNIRQIAEDLGVSTSTAYKWSARGAPFFPRCIRLRNGDIRVRKDWYESWLDSLEEQSQLSDYEAKGGRR